MTFASLHFLLFLPLVATASWGLRHRPEWRNNLLLAASAYFYACWDWRFVGLVWALAAVCFVAGQRVADSNKQAARRAWLALSLAACLGTLALFKYHDFFVPAVASWLHGLGLGGGDGRTLQLLLPLGISFYTFQALSYVLDVYRGQQAPCRSARDFLLFVSFFATVSAGPITRAGFLLPQLASASPQREYINEGVALVVRGFVRKIVFADLLATQLVAPAFATPEAHSGAFLLLALYAYTFQIYMDVAAYTDIARGAASMCGLRLPENFARPYAAPTVSSFWQRWHITMSSFFRDYLYFGLGGSQRGNVYVNLMLTFVAIGIWHGAGWNFVLYGLIHGAAVCVERWLRGRGLLQPGPEGSASWWLGVFVTFHVVVLSRVLFRADDLDHAGRYLGALFAGTGVLAPWPPAALAALLVAALLHWGAPAAGLQGLRAFGRMRVLAQATLLLALVYGLAALSTGDLPFVYMRFRRPPGPGRRSASRSPRPVSQARPCPRRSTGRPPPSPAG